MKRKLDPLLKQKALEMMNGFNHKWSWPIIRRMKIAINFEFESLFNTPSDKIRLKNRLERKRKNKIKAKFKREHIL